MRVMAVATGVITATRQAEFRKRLAAARVRVACTLAATDEERRALASHGSPDIAEDVIGDVVGGLLERLQGRERHELDEIDAALTRLEAGRYGLCEACRGPIPLARLRAMPATRRCANCQINHEAGR
jgi:DnaK suppressor protein